MTRSGNLNMVFIGLAMSSSWGNGHATTYRSLIAALARRGHRITFLERDVPWYENHRDLPAADYCRIVLYKSVAALQQQHADLVREADAVVVGSYVPDGVAVGEWAVSSARGIVAFYDIDTPVTIAGLENKRCDYLTAELIAGFDLYLSFTGGPFLAAIREKYRLPEVMALYCSADPDHYYPASYVSSESMHYDLGYMGTYSPDRQEALERLLIEPARRWPAGRFVVAGPQYPGHMKWPANVARIDHIAPEAHREFYNSQRFTLNLTRADMIRAGYSPSIRLFEAAACGTPIISDAWPGIDTVFVPGEEILISRGPEETLHWLQSPDEDGRRTLGAHARSRILHSHTPYHRAAALEEKLFALLARKPGEERYHAG